MILKEFVAGLLPGAKGAPMRLPTHRAMAIARIGPLSGVDTLFGVPSVYCASRYFAAENAANFSSTVTSSDLEAGYAADGYARAAACRRSPLHTDPVRPVSPVSVSLLPGNGILRLETKVPKSQLEIHLAARRDEAPARKPANSGLFGQKPENLRDRATAWWGSEDSNYLPSPDWSVSCRQFPAPSAGRMIATSCYD
jgi:hypothetical protein